jgi:gamma-glutamylcyclotransferase (GGCT)/AIG2-like uncharacterized protein YtfP
VNVGDKIFVYGTLKQGHGANSFLQGRSKFIADDRISGTMFSMGGYPGVRLGSSREFLSEGPTVKGEVYEVEDARLPSMLDQYEGYPNLYNRKKVRTEAGYNAWVYEINDPPSEDRVIGTGIWE